MLGSPPGWLKVSPIEVLVTRACDPSLHEPNYAGHLEVAEYINTKKANKSVFLFLNMALMMLILCICVEVHEKLQC